MCWRAVIENGRLIPSFKHASLDNLVFIVTIVPVCHKLSAMTVRVTRVAVLITNIIAASTGNGSCYCKDNNFDPSPGAHCLDCLPGFFGAACQGVCECLPSQTCQSGIYGNGNCLGEDKPDKKSNNRVLFIVVIASTISGTGMALVGIGCACFYRRKYHNYAKLIENKKPVRLLALT